MQAVKYSEDPFIFASADEDIYESVMQEHLRHAPVDDGLRVMVRIDANENDEV